jgi:hypothetical protein
MPAILGDEDWGTWLGEIGTPDDTKACLRTVEDIKWTITKEEKAAKKARSKPTISDPGGLI